MIDTSIAEQKARDKKLFEIIKGYKDVFYHDIIEEDVIDLDLNGAMTDVMGLYSSFGNFKYEFVFAMTKNEKRAFKFKITKI